MARRRSKSVKRSRRRSSRVGPRGGKIHVKPKGMSCKDFLRQKIAINMREFKNGKLMSNNRPVKSRAQVLAISYSQVKKGNPRCKF